MVERSTNNTAVTENCALRSEHQLAIIPPLPVFDKTKKSRNLVILKLYIISLG